MANKHICKNPFCQKVYDYCRACLFKPIYYHESGYCSEKCLIEDRQIKSQIEIQEQEPIVEVQFKKARKPKNETPIEEDTSSFNAEEHISDKDTETTLDE